MTVVRQEFEIESELPPKLFMLQVLNDTAKTYCFFWDRRDSNNSIDMTWEDVSKYYHRNNFRTSVRKLNTKGLIVYDESDEGIHIELITLDDVLGVQ